MTLSDIKTDTEYTVNQKKNGIKELVANEGYWITDKTLYISSGFFKKLRTKNIAYFGTVSDKQKEQAEAIIKEMLETQIAALAESGDN